MILDRFRAGIRWLRTGDRWIPGCFVLFFVCLAAWEAVLISKALNSFNGVVAEDAYTKGRAYDDVLARDREQRALGWQVAALFDQDGPTSGRLQVSVAGADGAPLSNASAIGKLRRYDGELRIVPLDFDTAAPGRLEAKVDAPAPGRWTAEIAVRRGGDDYRLRETFVLIPQ